jgi:hypothetical protein
MRNLEQKIRIDKLKNTRSITEITRALESMNDSLLLLVRRIYPYKIPKNYINWRSLSAVIAMAIMAAKESYKLASVDLATFLYVQKCTLWFVKKSPVYCLKEEILNSFLQTDILNSSEVIKDLKPQISNFLLLFPQGQIVSPGNSPVNFCVVHLSDRSTPENSQGSAHGITAPYLPQEHEVNLYWSTLDDNSTVWFSGIGLYSDGRVEFSDRSLGRNALTSKDTEFLAKMQSLVLQCFLLMQYEPEAITPVHEEEIERKVNPKGFTSKEAENKNFLYPRWLSEPTRVKTSRTNSEPTTTHASPSAHWRRGHWRNAAVGEGRVDRKWVWVRPALINP